MRSFIVEINAKLIVSSSSEPEELPADIYSQIAEFLPNEDHLMDLEVQTFPIPTDASGSSDRGDDSDSKKAEQA